MVQFWVILLEILPPQQLLLVCARVCLWVNTHTICVKCEAKQASGHAAQNVLSTELKRGSPVFWLRYLGWTGNLSLGGFGWKSSKGTIEASVGELGGPHQLAYITPRSQAWDRSLWHCFQGVCVCVCVCVLLKAGNCGGLSRRGRGRLARVILLYFLLSWAAKAIFFKVCWVSCSLL